MAGIIATVMIIMGGFISLPAECRDGEGKKESPAPFRPIYFGVVYAPLFLNRISAI